ncbi:carboxypeptidase-like regulatory domain-containing protein [uncultured Sunxiuqinia sp.]|uniref:carboxypeptidase-like regulatory domain-containing protein n=1 Tax=uncultured Sunxiuqinia sp. TaxID=1573825 RepID=UPI0030DB25C3|tara:strand:- start:18293 stop:19048 length:756 start_codon:yes stop_codon:yes gene_type:complete
MKKMIFIFTLFFALVGGGPLVAQDLIGIDPILIHLNGQVLNQDDGLPVPYVHVVNMRNHAGTTTNSQGRFSMEMLNVDSLAVSAMGFMKEYVHVPPKHHPDSLFTIWLRPIRFAIGEVEVKGRSNAISMEGISTGKPVDIDPELRGDAFNTKPPWYAAVFSPASFLQYHISRKERQKREVRSAIISEKRWEYLSQYYSKEIVMELTGLNEEEADSFMIYFNSKGILNEVNNNYQVREAILEQFELYQQEME